MSKVIERELTEIERNELLDRELDTVTGGSIDLGKYIGAAVEAAISPSSSGPPEVWAGCGWVPQWW